MVITYMIRVRCVLRGPLYHMTFQEKGVRNYNKTLLLKTPGKDQLDQFSLEEGIEAGSWSPSNISIPQHFELLELIPVVIDYPSKD